MDLNPASWITAAAQDARQDVQNVINQHLSRQAEDRAYERQKEFAQMGIRWRVADAQAAGLSPLFALGGGGASYSPSPVKVDFGVGEGLRDMGQNLSRAALAQATPEEKARNAAQLKLLESQIEETDARSEGVRLQNTKLWGELMSGGGMPSLYNESPFGGSAHGRGLVVPEGLQFSSGLRGAVNPEAVKIPSASVESRGVQAGDRPGWQKIRLSDGRSVYLPDAGEGQTFLGNNPLIGGLLAGPQVLFQMLEELGAKVSARGRSDRAALRKWLKDYKQVYDPNSEYWRSK